MTRVTVVPVSTTRFSLPVLGSKYDCTSRQRVWVIERLRHTFPEYVRVAVRESTVVNVDVKPSLLPSFCKSN